MPTDREEQLAAQVVALERELAESAAAARRNDSHASRAEGIAHAALARVKGLEAEAERLRDRELWLAHRAYTDGVSDEYDTKSTGKDLNEEEMWELSHIRALLGEGK